MTARGSAGGFRVEPGSRAAPGATVGPSAAALPLRLLATAGVLALLLTGCSSGPVTSSPSNPPTAVTATATLPATTAASPTRSSLPVPRVTGAVASNLRVPWGVAFLPDGSALVGQRPTGQVVRLDPGGEISDAGTVPGVQDIGEGGLLGMVGQGETVFAYFTSTGNDNRVVRMSWDGHRLGTPKPILTGIPAGGRHDGGGLVIGPDGMLWIGTGESGDTSLSQNLDSLGGKILRIRTDGSVPPDNPRPGSPIWSFGHRNVQGLAFDSQHRLWATEFGQDEWDELNLIVRGGNYGWPLVEGHSTDRRFRDPLLVWRTDQASPSGLAIVDDVAYLGALRGERLWQVQLLPNGRTGTPVARFSGQYGRIRTVVVPPGGGLWLTTSNTDGRGSPGDGDDRVLRVSLS